ncbi:MULTISPECIES: S41 family peptidase [unclassified Psychrobacter]|uniref:S41 family peptidase n=1 Tax=unclassified Psychrobacter TaxID=196806 RepID=UPI0018F61D88|nr:MULTISPECIES: S41 family peptidase [unclassified Psychrobacter]
MLFLFILSFAMHAAIDNRRKKTISADSAFVSSRLKPLCALGLFGVLLLPLSANAAADATKGIQLISLQGDTLPADNGIDEGMSDDDWIDAERDLSAVDVDPVEASDDTFNDVSLDDEADNPVADVPLNAISPETLKTFVSVIDLVRREYVEPVNDESLFNDAMSGMLHKLDSHAEFLDAEAYENLRAFTQGDVGDVGISAEYNDNAGYWVITQVLKNSSAAKQGIKTGDYLHQIDELKLDADQQDNDITQMLIGIAGTQVDVVTSRAGRRKHTSTLQRNNSHPQTIETKLVEGIAVVRLPAFQNNSRDKILKGLTQLNAPISGIVIDVRDNPGGVLDAAVQVASLFMEDTDVVQVESRKAPLKVLTTQGRALLKQLPVVILQNRYSASAAEVLASSLQTQKRATIVGEVSYGKGSVQSVIPLDDDHAVKLTVAHYLTATGKKIDDIGVTPDIALIGDEWTWEAKALEVLQQQTQMPGVRFVSKEK